MCICMCIRVHATLCKMYVSVWLCVCTYNICTSTYSLHVCGRIALHLQQTVVGVVLHRWTVKIARIVHVRGTARTGATDANDRRLVGVNAQIVAKCAREPVRVFVRNGKNDASQCYIQCRMECSSIGSRMLSSSLSCTSGNCAMLVKR